MQTTKKEVTVIKLPDHNKELEKMLLADRRITPKDCVHLTSDEIAMVLINMR